MFKYIKILILIAFLFPIYVFATEEELIIAGDNKFENFTFEVATGSKHNTFFVITNTVNEQQNIRIKIIDSSRSLGQRTRFFTASLDDSYITQLKQNNNDIILFCKKNDLNEDVKEWCEGKKVIDIIIKPYEVVKIPAVIDIAANEIDHKAKIIIENIDDNSIKGEQQITYLVPDKNIAQVELNEFILQKKNKFLDIKQWFVAGLQNKYIARFSVKNTGTETVDYKYCASVQSMWIDEDVNFCNEASIKYDEKQEHNVDIIMPRFGKIQIIGKIQYNGVTNKNQWQASEPIEIFIWPIQLVIIVIICICVCFICVLIYKYINKNKNMFGRKKKKQKNEYTDSYVVSSTDNIISIAQSYDMPWKELAKINEIEAPYILIPGETISVPSEESDKEIDTEQDVMTTTNKNDTISQPSQAVPMQTQAPVHKQMQVGDIANADVATNKTETQIMQQNDIQEKNISKNNKTQQPIEQTVAREQQKRKVTYAAPEKMLTKPASEPTTSAIDIEWMKDDEEIYNEEIQTQKKKLNTRFIIITTLILLGVGFISWWAVSWYLNSQEDDTVSVEALIAEEETKENIEVENKQDDGNTEKNKQDDGNTEEKDDKNGVEESKDENSNAESDDVNTVEIEPKDLTVQVLNAGAPVGAAGEITKKYSQKEYKTNSATNAINDYKGVIIYYAPDKKAGLDAIIEVVGDKYGTPKQEESDTVTKKYKADFVVVLGV